MTTSQEHWEKLQHYDWNGPRPPAYSYGPDLPRTGGVGGTTTGGTSAEEGICPSCGEPAAPGQATCGEARCIAEAGGEPKPEPGDPGEKGGTPPPPPAQEPADEGDDDPE